MGSISEKGFGKDHIGVGALLGIQDGGRIVGEWMVEKYHAAVFSDRAEEIQEFWNEIKHGRMKPYEVLKAYNVLLNTGMTEMWDIIKGTVSTNHIFNATDTKIGIGDSATGAQATDTDLLASTNKTYQAMDSGWPKTHTDDGAIGAGAFQSKATFGTSDANYAWNEAVVKNTNAASLKCLCRSTTGWGTKTSAATWVATHTLTLS